MVFHIICIKKFSIEVRLVTLKEYRMKIYILNIGIKIDKC